MEEIAGVEVETAEERFEEVAKKATGSRFPDSLASHGSGSSQPLTNAGTPDRPLDINYGAILRSSSAPK